MPSAPTPFAPPPARPISTRERPRRRALACFSAFCLLAAVAFEPIAQAAAPVREDPPAVLTFKDGAQPAKVLSLEALLQACGAQEVEVDDPYRGERTRYQVLSFRCVLDQGFAARGGAASLAQESLLLRARDGYTRPAAGSVVVDPNAQLAFGEPGLESPRFRPIDRRQIDPSPFYLVWTGVAHGDPHEHPWPYQLDTIEIAPFEAAFPHTAPTSLARSDLGWRGYALFQQSCSACHAINGEGGKVGPDLNVPRSIVEYRPLQQIRDYIRNPEATRYTSMPAHPQLTESDLDALIAYFRAMSARKHDPRPGAGS